MNWKQRLSVFAALACLAVAPSRCLADPLDALVAIFSTLPNSRQGMGAGCFVSTNGTVLTAYHVVIGASALEVDYQHKAYKDVTVLRLDPDHDLALLQVRGLEAAPMFMTIGTSPVQLHGGESLFAYGHSAQIFNQTVRADVTKSSMLSQEVRDPNTHQHIFALQNIAVIPLAMVVFNGLSGGPLVRNDQVIGIVSGSITPGGSIAWAIPVSSEAINEMPTINQIPRNVKWPRFTLMSEDWHYLRAEVSLGEALAHALDKFSDLVEGFSQGEREVTFACGNLRRGLEEAISITKDLIAQGYTTVGVLSQDQKRSVDEQFVPLVPACKLAYMKQVSPLQQFSSALNDIGQAASVYWQALPPTQNNGEILHNLDVQTRAAALCLMFSLSDSAQVNFQIKKPGLEPDTPMSAWLDFFESHHKNITILVPAEGDSMGTRLVAGLRQYETVLELFFKADQPSQ